MDAPPGHERIEGEGSGGTGEDSGEVPEGGYINRENMERYGTQGEIGASTSRNGCWGPIWKEGGRLDVGSCWKKQSDGLTPAEAVEVRDIFIVMLVISNARRPGDIGHLLLKTVEDSSAGRRGGYGRDLYSGTQGGEKWKAMSFDVFKGHGDKLKELPRICQGGRTGDVRTRLSRGRGRRLTLLGSSPPEVGVDLPHLIASINRKVAVTSIREADGSREEQEVLARHMAHNLATADRYYDRPNRRDERQKVLRKLRKKYVEAAHTS